MSQFSSGLAEIEKEHCCNKERLIYHVWYMLEL